MVSNVCSRRSFHSVPKLRHDYAETGVPNLMSPAGFSIAWTDYMTLVTEKLNELTAGARFPDIPPLSPPPP
jgi:Fe-Mn family superoxide dismutase